MGSPLYHGVATVDRSAIDRAGYSPFQLLSEPSSSPSYSHSSAGRILGLCDPCYRASVTTQHPLRSQASQVVTANALHYSTLSDPGSEDDSDSDSVCSFQTPKSCSSDSFLIDALPEDHCLWDPSSVLFQPKVMEPTLGIYKPADLIGRNVPNHLQNHMNVIRIKHDPFSGALNLVIGSTDDTRSHEEMHPYCAFRSDIKYLHISISEDSSGMPTAAQYEFLLWVLQWSQVTHGDTIEEISIKVPGTFLLHTDTSSAFDELAAFPNMHSLTWTGASHLIPQFLSRLVTGKTQAVAIRSELTVDDALHIAHLLGSSNILSLELGEIATCRSPIAGHFRESAYRSPILLRNLDTIKLCASIPPQGLFSTLSLPSLCKCEFLFSSCGPQGENALRALVASPLLGPNVLFIDVELQGPFVGMADMMVQLKERSPFAYASFRKR